VARCVRTHTLRLPCLRAEGALVALLVGCGGLR
jgi:hypothetical protein